jgi:hypothetical protein
VGTRLLVSQVAWGDTRVSHPAGQRLGEEGEEMILADIASGEVDWADIFFLIAVILFVIGGALAYQAKALWATIVSVGLAFVALGWLVL